MKKVSSLKLRQSMSRILESLRKNGEPILLEQRHKPAAVIISLSDFQERFVEHDSNHKREKLMQEILAMRRQGAGERSSDEILAEMRTGK